MPSLFDNPDYKPQNQSVIFLLEEYEQQYKPLFNKVKNDWLPNIRDFLREETGLKLVLTGFLKK